MIRPAWTKSRECLPRRSGVRGTPHEATRILS